MQVAPTLVPLLKFYFHEEVRKAAVSAMPELLRSAKLAVEKGQSQGRNESYIKQLSDYIIPPLVEALHKVIVLFVPYIFTALYPFFLLRYTNIFAIVLTFSIHNWL